MISESLQSYLSKEQDELNTWNRSVAQIYFAWYTVFLTVNGAALTWVFGYGALDKHLKGIGVAFAMFGIWNLLGVISTIAVGRYTAGSNKRLDAIRLLMLESSDSANAKSPMPAAAAKTAYWANGIAMASLVGIWVYLLCQV